MTGVWQPVQYRRWNPNTSEGVPQVVRYKRECLGLQWYKFPTAILFHRILLDFQQLKQAGVRAMTGDPTMDRCILGLQGYGLLAQLNYANNFVNHYTWPDVTIH
jgi:hypothetical protein